MRQNAFVARPGELTAIPQLDLGRGIAKGEWKWPRMERDGKGKREREGKEWNLRGVCATDFRGNRCPCLPSYHQPI